MPDRESIELGLTSIVSHRNGRGYVCLTVGAERVQLEPNHAREIAQWILETAEAAECDAFLVEWVVGLFPGDDHSKAAMILRDFREAREGRRGIPQTRASIEERASPN